MRHFSDNNSVPFGQTRCAINGLLRFLVFGCESRYSNCKTEFFCSFTQTKNLPLKAPPGTMASADPYYLSLLSQAGLPYGLATGLPR
jgi:hypothetical protein